MNENKGGKKRRKDRKESYGGMCTSFNHITELYWPLLTSYLLLTRVCLSCSACQSLPSPVYPSPQVSITHYHQFISSQVPITTTSPKVPITSPKVPITTSTHHQSTSSHHHQYPAPVHKLPSPPPITHHQSTSSHHHQDPSPIQNLVTSPQVPITNPKLPITTSTHHQFTSPSLPASLRVFPISPLSIPFPCSFISLFCTLHFSLRFFPFFFFFFLRLLL